MNCHKPVLIFLVDSKQSQGKHSVLSEASISLPIHLSEPFMLRSICRFVSGCLWMVVTHSTMNLCSICIHKKMGSRDDEVGSKQGKWPLAPDHCSNDPKARRPWHNRPFEAHNAISKPHFWIWSCKWTSLRWIKSFGRVRKTGFQFSLQPCLVSSTLRLGVPILSREDHVPRWGSAQKGKNFS